MRFAAKVLFFAATLTVLFSCGCDRDCVAPEGSAPALASFSDGSLTVVFEGHKGLGVAFSNDRGSSWKRSRPAVFKGLSCPAIIQDADTLFLVAVRSGERYPSERDPFGADEAELLAFRSVDKGRSWTSEGSLDIDLSLFPDNASWRLVCTPGRGIVTSDLTWALSVWRRDYSLDPDAPSTYSKGVQTASPAFASGVMTSADRGRTWRLEGFAKEGATQAALCEPAPGTLMLSLRDNARTGRAIYTSADLGRNWERYEADGMLSDPVGPASILTLATEQNCFGHPVVLFCNCDSELSLDNLKLKMSTDGGFAYPFERKLNQGDSQQKTGSLLSDICGGSAPECPQRPYRLSVFCCKQQNTRPGRSPDGDNYFQRTTKESCQSSMPISQRLSEKSSYSSIAPLGPDSVAVVYSTPDDKLLFEAVGLKELCPGPVMRHVPVPVVTDRDVRIAELCVAPWHIIPELSVSVSGLPEGAFDSWKIENGRLKIRLDGEKIPEACPAFEVTVSGDGLTIEGCPRHRVARKIRDKGDYGAALYRIPGLVRTHSGVLVASYDARWKDGRDLPNDIDIGVSRSLDNGRTWSPMQIVMDMGRWGGLPEALNGISDSCLMLDEQTGDILLFGFWCHGGDVNVRTKYSAQDGFEPSRTGQMMMSRSSDEGLTWSEPVNITRQIKDSLWVEALEGPGTGITMADGTLVVPLQFYDASRIPSATIIYSRDRGQSWQRGHGNIRQYVNEAQVVEIEPGVIMINARDRSISGRRAVYVTRDMGESWEKHPGDSTLLECFCQASLMKVEAADNVLGRDILLFCNCAHNPRQRRFMTVRMSYDGGLSWPCAMMLDYYHGMGYSCMTMIDKETLGIVYESSEGSEIFQSIPITELAQTNCTI